MKRVMYGDFTQTPNELILDKNLTSNEKLFWIYLNSKPDTWKFYDGAICSELGISRKTAQRYRKGLVKAGYLACRMRTGDGGEHVGIDYYLFAKRGDSHSFIVTSDMKQGDDGSVYIDYSGVDKSDHGGVDKNDHPRGESKMSTLSNTYNNTDIVAPKDDDENSEVLSETFVDALHVATYLADKLEEANEAYKYPSEAKLNGWAREIDRAIRLDGRTKEDLVSVIDWIHNDPAGSFWIPNIASGTKLRAQFDRLWFQMHNSKPKQNIRDRILSFVKKGEVFLKFTDKDTGEKISLCIFGDFNSLYDYNRSKYLDKDKADRLWKYIENHFDEIFKKESK